MCKRIARELSRISARSSILDEIGACQRELATLRVTEMSV
jgi:hypothetical protein